MDQHSGIEHSSGGGMSGRLESDESGSLGVFLSSISRNRLVVEFGVGKCMKYFSLGLFILVVNGGMFDQLRHMRNIGWNMEEHWSDM